MQIDILSKLTLRDVTRSQCLNKENRELLSSSYFLSLWDENQGEHLFYTVSRKQGGQVVEKWVEVWDFATGKRFKGPPLKLPQEDLEHFRIICGGVGLVVGRGKRTKGRSCFLYVGNPLNGAWKRLGFDLSANDFGHSYSRITLSVLDGGGSFCVTTQHLEPPIRVDRVTGITTCYAGADDRARFGNLWYFPILEDCLEYEDYESDQDEPDQNEPEGEGPDQDEPEGGEDQNGETPLSRSHRLYRECINKWKRTEPPGMLLHQGLRSEDDGYVLGIQAADESADLWNAPEPDSFAVWKQTSAASGDETRVWELVSKISLEEAFGEEVGSLLRKPRAVTDEQQLESFGSSKSWWFTFCRGQNSLWCTLCSYDQDLIPGGICPVVGFQLSSKRWLTLPAEWFDPTLHFSDIFAYSPKFTFKPA